jgi:hypothetical protein
MQLSHSNIQYLDLVLTLYSHGNSGNLSDSPITVRFRAFDMVSKYPRFSSASSLKFQERAYSSHPRLYLDPLIWTYNELFHLL